MGQDTVKLNLAAALQGGTKEAFRAIADSFKLLGREVKATAKDLHAAGKTGAADAMGHLGMAIDRVSQSSKGFAKTGKDVRDSLQSNAKAVKDYTNDLTVVQQAYKKWSDSGKATGNALTVAQKRTDALSKSIHQMGLTMNTGGASWKEIDKWKNSLDFTKVMSGVKSGFLKPTVSGFKDLSEVGTKLLSVNDKLNKSFTAAGGYNTTYQNTLKKATDISTRYATAVKQLGKEYGITNAKTLTWAPTLSKVHNAMNQIGTVIGKSANSMSHWTNTSKLASVAQGVLAGNIQVTTKGFQIMNDKGLKAFNGLTIQAADKLGILSKSFDNLSGKTGAQALTAYGKAINDSIGKTDKFSQGISNLAKKYGVMSASFSSQYEDMKRSDAIWNKHVTTLQKTGQVSEQTAEKMRKGFNAAKVSSQQLATTLALPNKQYQELDKTINRVAVATGKSTAELRKQADALRAQGKPHTEIVNSLNASIGVHRKYIQIQDQIAAKERQLAGLRGTSVNSIRKVTSAILDGAKSEEQLVKVATIRNQNLQTQINTEKQAIASIKRMENAKISLAKKYGTLASSNEKFARALKTTVERYGQSAEAGKKMELSLSRYAKSLNDAHKPTTMFGKAIADVGQHIKSFASYATAATFIAGLVGGFNTGVTAVVEFDQALKDLQAITGATDRQVVQMGETIKDVASNTKFSATEVADGMKTLGQSGLSAKESIETIAAVSDLATGTLSDMSTSVDLVTTAMRVFDISSSESSRVADVFANAVNKSKLTIDKLRIAFNYVGPVAASAGASFEDVAASMMTLANTGMRASTIGTGLRQVLSGIVKPSKEFEQGVRDAGFVMDDFNLKTNSMKTVIERLSIVVQDSEDAFKMFGLRGATAVVALTNSTSQGFNKLMESVNQTGTAVRMAEKQMEGLGVRIKNMWDKTKNLSIAVGETGLAAALGFAVDAMRGLLDGLTTITESPLAGFIVKTGLATTALLTMTVAVRALIATSLAQWFVGAATGATGFVATVTAAKAAAVGLATSIPVIGWVLIGVGAALTGVITLFNKWENGATDAFNKAKNFTDELSTLGDKMAVYQKKVAGLDKSSNEFKNANLVLRGELTKVSKRMDELGTFAKKAELSINALDGSFSDGGKAVEDYREKLEKLEKVNFLKSVEAADAALKQSISDTSVWYNNLKSSTSNFLSKLSTTFKATGLRMMGATEAFNDVLDEGERKVDAYTEGHKKLNKAIGDFKKGEISFKELKTVLLDTDVAGTKLGQTITKSMSLVEEGAAEAIGKLVQMGKINMTMTSEEVVRIATYLKAIPEGADEAVKAVAYLFDEMKQASQEVTDGLASKWAKELGTVGADYSSFVAQMQKDNNDVAWGLLTLNQKVIKSYEDRQKAIAQAKLDNDAALTKNGDMEQWVKNNEKLKTIAKNLQAEMRKDADMNRYLDLQNLNAWFAKEQQANQTNKELLGVSEEAYYVQKEALAKQFATKYSTIMGDIVDPEKLKEQYEKSKKYEQDALDTRLRVLEESYVKGKIGEQEYADRKVAINKEAYQKLKDMAEQYLNDVRNAGATGDIRTDAFDEYRKASNTAKDNELANIRAIRDEQKKAAEELTAITDKKLDKEKAYNQKVLDLVKAANDKINNLPRTNKGEEKAAIIRRQLDEQLAKLKRNHQEEDKGYDEDIRKLNAKNQVLKASLDLQNGIARAVNNKPDVKEVAPYVVPKGLPAEIKKVGDAYVQVARDVGKYNTAVDKVDTATKKVAENTGVMAEGFEAAKDSAEALSVADIDNIIDDYSSFKEQAEEPLEVPMEVQTPGESEWRQIDRELMDSLKPVEVPVEPQSPDPALLKRIDKELEDYFRDIDAANIEIFDKEQVQKEIKDIKAEYADVKTWIQNQIIEVVIELSASAFAKIKSKIDDLSKSKVNIPVLLELSQSSYNAVQRSIDKLKRTKIVIPVSYKEGRKPKGGFNGGQVGRMSSGGRIAGISSTRDTEHILARKGEWFTRNEAADYWGDGIMSGISAPFSKMGRTIATVFQQSQMSRTNVSVGRGLQSGSNGDILNTLQDFGTVNLNFSTPGPAIPTVLRKSDVTALLSQLKTMSKLSS